MKRSATGKTVFADQGYLSKALLARRWQQRLHWVTGTGRNRKNDLLPLLDKVLLRKCCIIETLFAKLTSSMGLEHTRHRSPHQRPGPCSLLPRCLAISNPMPSINHILT